MRCELFVSPLSAVRRLVTEDINHLRGDINVDTKSFVRSVQGFLPRKYIMLSETEHVF